MYASSLSRLAVLRPAMMCASRFSRKNPTKRLVVLRGRWSLRTARTHISVVAAAAAAAGIQGTMQERYALHAPRPERTQSKGSGVGVE